MKGSRLRKQMIVGKGQTWIKSVGFSRNERRADIRRSEKES